MMDMIDLDGDIDSIYITPGPSRSGSRSSLDHQAAANALGGIHPAPDQATPFLGTQTPDKTKKRERKSPQNLESVVFHNTTTPIFYHPNTGLDHVQRGQRI